MVGALIALRDSVPMEPPQSLQKCHLFNLPPVRYQGNFSLAKSRDRAPGDEDGGDLAASIRKILAVVRPYQEYEAHSGRGLFRGELGTGGKDLTNGPTNVPDPALLTEDSLFKTDLQDG